MADLMCGVFKFKRCCTGAKLKDYCFYEPGLSLNTSVS